MLAVFTITPRSSPSASPRAIWAAAKRIALNVPIRLTLTANSLSHVPSRYAPPLRPCEAGVSLAKTCLTLWDAALAQRLLDDLAAREDEPIFASRLHAAVGELPVIELGVRAACGQEIRVGPPLEDSSSIQIEDLVRGEDRR